MEKELTINDIMTFELTGVIDTINEYTRENFIHNYTEVLSKCNYPKDKDKILAITYRLIDWYTRNYDDIQSNQYLYNRHEHYKSIEVLNNLLKQLLK